MKQKVKITLITAFLLLTSLSNAQSSPNKFDNSIKEPSKTIYKDGTAAATKVYDDSKNAVSTLYKDIKTTTPTINKAISKIAKDLKVTADSVWGILVKQQLVWSIAFLILTLASIFNWHLFYKNINKKIIEEETVTRNKIVYESVPNPNFDSYYENRSGYEDNIKSKRWLQKPIGEEIVILPLPTNQIQNYKYLHLTICLVMSGFSTYHFGAMLTGFINPEYGAMKDIIFVAMKLK